MPGMTTIESMRFPEEGPGSVSRPRRFKYVNVGFVVVVALLVCYGLAVVYSATIALTPVKRFQSTARPVT